MCNYTITIDCFCKKYQCFNHHINGEWCEEHNKMNIIDNINYITKIHNPYFRNEGCLDKLFKQIITQIEKDLENSDYSNLFQTVVRFNELFYLSTGYIFKILDLMDEYVFDVIEESVIDWSFESNAERQNKQNDELFKRAIKLGEYIDAL